MDFEEIKEIIKADGGKIIIIEDGKPVMVITSFEDYRKNLRQKPEKLNFPEKKIEKQLPKELEEDELKIEDLPF